MSLWSLQHNPFQHPKGIKYRIFYNDKLMSISQVLKMMTTNPDFRSFYSGILSGCPFESFYWENMPISQDNLDKTYEFVLIDADILGQMKADKSSFLPYFKDTEKYVVSFLNLGRDALLIVPTPHAKEDVYGHLANMVRYAPEEQVQALWQNVGEKCLELLGRKNIWLSTCGIGVPWVHVRLDTYPKYYRYKEYSHAQI